jgi:cytochrome oxidase Cu insertion factor (SCO1/SenC/PrrC family)
VARSLCALRRCANAVVTAAAHTSTSIALARNLLLLYKFIDLKHGKPMEVNDKAPEFSLANEEGKQITLKDYRGKNVVLFFYPKANTPG